MTTYAVDNRGGRNVEDLREEARDYVRRALLVEPHNPIVLALCSHVHGFTLGEFSIAYELAERSLRLDRNTPFGWAFFGLAQLYAGHTHEAHLSISHAREIAGEGPHRYLIDFLTCMSSLLTGRLDDAVRLGTTVTLLAADFAPAVRYLLAAHLARNDMDSAVKTVRQMRQIEPDFELSYFADPAYPVPALRNSHTIDLKSLPKLL